MRNWKKLEIGKRGGDTQQSELETQQRVPYTQQRVPYTNYIMDSIKRPTYELLRTPNLYISLQQAHRQPQYSIYLTLPVCPGQFPTSVPQISDVNLCR